MKVMAAIIISMIMAVPAAAGDTVPLCRGAHRVTCVVDGDTFWWRGEKIRIENVDAPEVHAPCLSERRLAREATLRLKALLSSASPVLGRTGTDRFGRTLADVSVAGVDVGRTLIEEGLARPWRGHKERWCQG